MRGDALGGNFWEKFPPNLPQNFQRMDGESANIVPLVFGWV